MGFLDKAKAQASTLAQKAQEGVNQVQTKPAGGASPDGMLRDLGAWYYAQRSGTDGGHAGTEIERLVAALQAHEAQYGPLGGAAPAAPAAAAAVDEPAESDAAMAPPPVAAEATQPPPSPEPGASPPPAAPAPPPPAQPAPSSSYTLDDL